MHRADRARWWSAISWSLTALLLCALGGVGGWLIRDLHHRRRPAFLAEPDRRAQLPRRAAAREPGMLWLAGSGSNIPLTRVLAARYRAQVPGGGRVKVHRSIGSTGGIRALGEGAIDLAMISRPLRADERRPGMQVIPYARVAVVVAAHASVPERGLSSADLLEIFGGERRRWSDGSRLLLILRERGDSSHRAMSQAVPGFAEVVERAYRRKLGRIVYSDLDMQSALCGLEGAVGLFDLGAVRAQRLPIRVLALDGVEPSVETLRTGRYSVTKDLAFAASQPLAGAAARFVDFVRSAEGRAVILDSGYLPLPGGSR